MTVLTAGLVAGMAILAGGFLFALHRIHGQMAHETAALSVLQKGRNIARQLAAERSVEAGLKSEKDWRDFATAVRRIAGIEQGLQYVSVVEDDVTLFHEQMKRQDNPAESGSDILVGRKLLQSGDTNIPLLVFTAPCRAEEGRERMVEVALRRDTVGEEESSAMMALGSMFKLSLITVIAAFGISTALIVWLMRREAGRERRRREEEHLAFAGMLANGIVHDFRNPMSSLKLDAQMLRREVDKGASSRRERIAELSEHICSTTDRMEKVFQEFLLLSRPAAEPPSNLDVGRCIREILDLVSPRFEHAGVKAVLEAPEKPVIVKATSAAIRRALLNVITNAEQFSKSGGTVLIRLSCGGGRAAVEVLDEGPGIPPEIGERIFDMFVSTRPGGIGLGLFLAKTAVEQCGGAIHARNRPEGGACFTLTLPLAEEG